MEVKGFNIQLDEDKLFDAVVERVTERVLYKYVDEQGRPDPDMEDEQFETLMTKRFEELLSQAVDRIAERHILPNLEAYVEDFQLQETSKWGEPKKEPLTFTE